MLMYVMESMAVKKRDQRVCQGRESNIDQVGWIMGLVAVETRKSLADTAGVMMSVMMSITIITEKYMRTIGAKSNRLHNVIPFSNSHSKYTEHTHTHTLAVTPLPLRWVNTLHYFSVSMATRC